MDNISSLTVIERSKISPPPATINHHRSLPLTFFDVPWLLLPPIQHLFFYHFPHSKSHFMKTVVPKLKHSLSITLQHYFPFVSSLVVFPDSTSTRKPEIRYTEGDSVALTFAECTLDFDDLTGNHPRKCENFYPLVPPLGVAFKGPDYVTIPLFSVQVTYFINSGGISIGMTNHHSLCDASTRYSFLKAWSLVSESGGDDSFLTNGSQPIYDRLIDIPKLVETKLNEINLENFYQTPSLIFPSDSVRATFVLTRTHINQLKKHVLKQLQTVEYLSSYTVTCGYIWSCVAKSFVKMGEKKGEDELEQFVVWVDCRSRVDPPLPATYFGNCIAPCIVTIKSHVLSGENGFVSAAKLLGEGINKMVNSIKEGMLKDAAERWHDGFKIPARLTGVSGTLKVNFYGMDFGWGKPIKYEPVPFYSKNMVVVPLSASKGSPQDFEVGVGFQSMQVEAFANIFIEGLESAIAP